MIEKKEYLLDKIDKSWEEFFSQFGWDKIFLILEKVEKNNFLPEKKNVFRLFRELNVKEVKVIILGQDPYHQKEVADGFAFSTDEKITPASLRNIFFELESDLGTKTSRNSLHSWVKQGVFLLNTCLTVEERKPLSHKSYWSDFSKSLLCYLNKKNKDVIWVFWGKSAKDLKNLCEIKSKYVISSVHPSPFSANHGFFNSKPFSKINSFLKEKKEKEIIWNT